MNHGISLMQPPHFVAQRSRRRGLPLKLESEIALPEAFSNTKSGAGLRADCGSTATRMSAAYASEHAATHMARVRIGISHLTPDLRYRSPLRTKSKTSKLRSCRDNAMLAYWLFNGREKIRYRLRSDSP